MAPLYNQKTLNSSIEFTGVGLHTGEGVHMVIEPAKINHGVKFQRIDLENQPILPADINLVTDTQRSTTLEKDNVKIVTVEHLMSALYALGVNNVLIKMDSSEVPILDGSAKCFVEKIQKVGLKIQDALLKYSKSSILFNILGAILFKQNKFCHPICYLRLNKFDINLLIIFFTRHQ